MTGSNFFALLTVSVFCTCGSYLSGRTGGTAEAARGAGPGAEEAEGASRS